MLNDFEISRNAEIYTTHSLCWRGKRALETHLHFLCNFNPLVMASEFPKLNKMYRASIDGLLSTYNKSYLSVSNLGVSCEHLDENISTSSYDNNNFFKHSNKCLLLFSGSNFDVGYPFSLKYKTIDEIDIFNFLLDYLCRGKSKRLYVPMCGVSVKPNCWLEDTDTVQLG